MFLVGFGFSALALTFSNRELKIAMVPGGPKSVDSLYILSWMYLHAYHRPSISLSMYSAPESYTKVNPNYHPSLSHYLLPLLLQHATYANDKQWRKTCQV